MTDISVQQARRIALAAQGFADAPPSGRVDVRHLQRVIDRVALVQLDSVNVVVRAHYMPFYSRLGPYPMGLLDDFAYRRRRVFEYFAHEQALLATGHLPLLRHRMEEVAPWSRVRRIMEAYPDYIEAVYREVAERGPLAGSDLADPGRRTGPWWGMARGTTALEYLFLAGRLGVAERVNFARRFDLIERVLPPEALADPAPPAAEAHRRLLSLAADAMGIATLADLADYFRLSVPVARPRVAELVEAGELEEVTVEGWAHPAFMMPGTRIPRRVEGRALVSPFDSLIWFRPRIERLFGFHYRIEIYVPEPQRTFGYYVYPFLLDDRLVARVDLKADRKAGTLIARGTFVEDGPDSHRVAGELAGELTSMAAWLGLERVVVGRRGNLAAPLRRALGRGGSSSGQRG